MLTVPDRPEKTGVSPGYHEKNVHFQTKIDY